MSVNVFFLEATNMKEYEREKYNVIDSVNHLTEANSKLFVEWPFKQYDARDKDIAKLLSVRKCVMKAKEMKSQWVVICDETVDFPSRFPTNLIISKNKLIKVICLDKKNKVGKGLPVDDIASVMFHHSTFDYLIEELHSETSKKMKDFDFSMNYLNWIIKQLGVPCSRYPMITSMPTSEQVSKPVVVEPEPEVVEPEHEPEPVVVEPEPEPEVVEPEPEPEVVEPEPEPEVVEPELEVVEPEPEPEVVEPEPEPEPEPETEPEPYNDGYVNFLNAFKKND